MKRVGILGAGQLGCMLSSALHEYGAEVFFYDPNPNSPGFLRTPHFTCGKWNDTQKLTHFFSQCDVVTYEFENVSVTLLNEISQKTKTPLFPSSNVLALTQNRISEKSFLKKHNLPVCQFIPIYSKEELTSLLYSMPYPFIIKTAIGGYDGKGQWKIENKLDANKLLMENLSYPLIQEELIDIKMEISCISAQDQNEKIIHFPIFENRHKNHILDITILPANISNKLKDKIIDISTVACKKLNIIGLLTTEFFISKSNEIIVNEFAPRPHNSGHISNKSCTFSQFNILAKILLNLPIQSPKLLSGHFCMGNLLGDIWLNKNNIIDWKVLENYPDMTEFMIYGKREAKLNRKMGHFIVKQKSRKLAIQMSEAFKKDLYGSKQ